MADSDSKHCQKCGSNEFYKSGRCAKCAREYSKQYRANNPDSVKDAQSRWEVRNSDYRKAYRHEWRQQNSEHVAAYESKYRADNAYRIRTREKLYRATNRKQVLVWSKNFRIRHREKVAAWNVAYHLRNAAAIRNKVLRWQRENPDKCRVRNQNRRARQTEGKLSNGIVQKLFSLQRGKCPCCGKPLGNNFHLDHIVPLAKGGPNIDSNVQLLRKQCNHQKSAKSPIDFMRSRGFLL